MVLCIACLSMVAGWQRSAARSFWVMPVNIGLVLSYIFILMRMIVRPLREEIVKSKEALSENFDAVEKVSELSLSLLKKG